MNYENANQILQGRNKDSKKLANNTYLIRNNDSIAVKLHNTNVVTFYSDGRIILDSGTWRTNTTKDRINTYSGFRISQNSGKWTLHVNGNSYPFNDGITIKNNKVSNFGKLNLKADKKLKDRIKKYAELCASKIPLAHPNSGDCWYCHMITDDKKTLGDAFKDSDHLKSHMTEKYVVPSLVYNAMIEAGYNPTRNIQFSLVFDNPSKMTDLAQDTVKRSVTKYLQKRFGFAR